MKKTALKWVWICSIAVLASCSAEPKVDTSKEDAAKAAQAEARAESDRLAKAKKEKEASKNVNVKEVPDNFGYELNRLARKEYDEQCFIINPDMFNQKIADESIDTPEKLVYRYMEVTKQVLAESKVTHEDVGEGLIEIILMNYDVPGAMIKTEKIIMLATRQGNSWDVNEIRKNWRCGSKANTGDFGVTPCK